VAEFRWRKNPIPPTPTVIIRKNLDFYDFFSKNEGGTLTLTNIQFFPKTKKDLLGSGHLFCPILRNPNGSWDLKKIFTLFLLYGRMPCLFKRGEKKRNKIPI
jgi:hypothetical protein